MDKNIFDKMSDLYDDFHLKDTEIQKGNSTITISPKLKLTLGWSLFILCCVLAYFAIGLPFKNSKVITEEDKQNVLEEDIDTSKEHNTMVPYEKDAYEELNSFVESYYNAITNCDNLALQDMVTDSSEFDDLEVLKKKAEFITGYENLTVYTKAGLDDGSYVTFVVSNVVITGVNSSPYDIATYYIVNGERGYRINNGELPEDTQKYIDKVKGDEDIQKIYRSIEKKNNEMKEKDSSLRDFFDIISRRNVETNSAAEQLSTEATTAASTEEVTQAPVEEDVSNEEVQEEQPQEDVQTDGE